MRAFHSELLAAGDEELLGLAAEDAIEDELALGCAAQLEEQLAAIVGHRIHGVDEPHARSFVEMRGVGYIFQEDENVPFGAFAAVMDAVKQAGITNVSIVTQPLESKPAAPPGL